jgi:hypothetical protein
VAESVEQFDLRSPEVGRIFAGLALAEVHLEHGDDGQALPILEEVTRATAATHRPTLQSLVALQQAKAARVLGDEVVAAVQLDEARLSYPEADAAVRQVLGEEAATRSTPPSPSG